MPTGGHGPFFWTAPNNSAEQPEVTALALCGANHPMVLRATTACRAPQQQLHIHHQQPCCSTALEIGAEVTSELLLTRHSQPVTAGTQRLKASLLGCSCIQQMPRLGRCGWDALLTFPMEIIIVFNNAIWVEILPRMSVVGGGLSLPSLSAQQHSSPAQCIGAMGDVCPLPSSSGTQMAAAPLGLGLPSPRLG